MERSILSTTSERIIHTFTKEEIESFAAMDLDKFLDWVEKQGTNVSPVMILYLKNIHKMCVNIVSDGKSSIGS